jgi:HD-GYP domain-containing protein (c-di-GMP phosphodiesterase class II)/pSer/pThr/pTyr-binding forkhead associated (FHA) protein
MSLLILERGSGVGKRIPLVAFPITIGRDPANQVVLDDDEVSRYHLRIKQRGKLFIAEDLESRNGTYINGDRILNSIVKNGDKILVGSTEMIFVTSEPDIRLATEIMKFDMIVAEELGLKGPIELDGHGQRNKFTPIRLPLTAAVNPNEDIKSVRTIFELHSNIIVINDLEEAANTLLKYVGQIMPSASRAAFFIWVSGNRQLIPYASRHYKKKEPFLLSQRALEDVITRKQGVILQADSNQATYSGRTRLVIPIIHNENPICALHIEADSQLNAFPQKELELLQALIHRCAPTFEAMMLRQELDSWFVSMIETMIATVEAKDTYTRGHSERVSRYSMAIAEELKLNREIKKLLLISSLCHDIGKIGIPDAILKKAALLSADEYEEMKLHPTIGAEIINNMPNAQRFISGVKHHHEKWDGTGYPDGLAGEDIPFFGRIVAIADVFDAMISGRAYSGFMDQEEAISRLEEEKELFDPEILKAFLRAFESGALTLKTDTQNKELPDQEPSTTTTVAPSKKVRLDPAKAASKSKTKK